MVAIEGTGQAADLLAFAWRFLHDDSPKARTYTGAQLRNMVKKTFPKEDLDKTLQLIYECVDNKNLVGPPSASQPKPRLDLLPIFLSSSRPPPTSISGGRLQHGHKRADP